MMNNSLQIILFISSFLFLVFIIKKITSKQVELQYSIIWIVTSGIFIVLSIFPEILRSISVLIHIETPVNALFLIILFLFINIIFSLSIALGNSQNRIKVLAQEIGIIKLKLNKLENEKQ